MPEVAEVLHPIVTVYVFKSEYCDACKSMEPVLREFRSKYPMRVLVVPLDIDRKPTWEIGGWAPHSRDHKQLLTPGFAAVVDGELVWHHVGIVSLRDLERVLKEHL